MPDDKAHHKTWHPQNEPGLGRPDEAVIERGHERESVGVRGIVISAIALIAFLGFVHLLMLDTIRFLIRHEEKAPPRPEKALSVPIAAPPLQPDQPAEYREMQAAADQVLSSYGWVNRNTNTVRVPIERAFEMLLQEQLQTEDLQQDQSAHEEGGKP